MNKEIEKIKSFVEYVGLKEYNRKINFKIDDIKNVLPEKDIFHMAFCDKKKSEIVLSNKIPKKYANIKFIWKTLLHELAHLKPIKGAFAFVEENGVFRESTIQEKLHCGTFEREFKRLKKKYPFIYFLEYLERQK